MNILIVSYFFPPLDSVASLRPYHFAKGLAGMGNNVHVLTAQKPERESPWILPTDGLRVHTVSNRVLSYLFNRARQNSGTEPASTQSSGGLRQFLVQRGIGVLGRMPDLTSLWAYSARRYLRQCDIKFDVVVSTYGPASTHGIADYAKRLGISKRWIADYRDLWSIHHHYPGLFPFNRYEQHLEKKLLRNVDAVTTVSAELSDEFYAAFGIQPTVVSTGFNPQERSAHGKDHPPSEKLHLLYTGTLYPNHPNVDRFLAAAKNINVPAGQLAVTFAGNDFFGVTERVRTLGLEDTVKHIGLLPRQQALAMQSESDVLLFFENDNHNGITTGKIFEYLSSGTPIWRIGGAENTPASRIIAETKAGVPSQADLEASLRNLLDAPPSKRTADSSAYAYQETVRDLAALL